MAKRFSGKRYLSYDQSTAKILIVLGLLLIGTTTFAQDFEIKEDPVCFDDTAKFINLTSNDSVISHVWKFGDGNISNEDNPGHIYNPQPGKGFKTFKVTLVVFYENYSGEDSITKHIEIARPIAFEQSNAGFCEGDSTRLEITNPSNPLSSFKWSTGEHSSSIYVDSPGRYGVTITDNQGCTSTDSINVTEIPVPPVDDKLGPDTAVCGTYTLDSEMNNASVLWNTGDTIPHVNAKDSGLYWVQVTNNLGCTNYDSVVLNLHDYPEFDIDSNIAVCEGTNLNAAIEPDNVKWYKNEFLVQNPVINPADTGWYAAEIKENHCTTLDSAYITLKKDPVAKFIDTGYSKTIGFINQSRHYNESTWRFGDGLTSKQENPVHTYQVTDTSKFMVQLTASNDCKIDTAYDTLSIPKTFMKEHQSKQNLVKVYPTAFHNLLNVKSNYFDNNDLTFILRQIDGKKLIEQSINLGENEIEQIRLNNLKQGVYFIAFFNKENNLIHTKKVVKL